MLKINQNDFTQLASFIKGKYGLNLLERKVLVESRLNNYVLESGFDNFSDYLDMVYHDSSNQEMANLINRLTTNHTYFMRESAHFTHLMDKFLPYAEKHINDHDLRIWSAGCSYGNEPYNIAMCLDEYFGFRGHQWDLKILATDISLNALKSAANGIYPASAVESIPEKWKEKYFFKIDDNHFQVNDRIRKMVVFKYHNLMDEIEFRKNFDLIFCRNVMIYFDDATKSKLCKKFYNATNDGGYLYIGHAESEPEDMPYVRVEPAIYRKENGK